MIPRFKPYFNTEEFKAVINKKQENIINDFEEQFANLVDSKYAISFPSGRIALYSLLKELDIKKSNVLLPAYTCIVVPAAVTASNNKLCFVDISLSDYNMKIEDISSNIAKEIKCVVPTNMYGYPFDTKKLRDIVGENVYIIEDAAQAILTKNVGKYGDAAFYSFNFEKQIFTFGGGMVTTNNEEIYHRLKKFKEENIIKNSFKNEVIKTLLLMKTPLIFSDSLFKFMLMLWEKNTSIQWRKGGLSLNNPNLSAEKIYLSPDQFQDYSKVQAAVGMSQIKKIHEIIKKRTQISKYYNEQLKDLKEIILPPVKDGCTFSHYTMRVKQRNKFEEFMMKKKIQINKVFDYSLPHLPLYNKYMTKSERFPNSLIAGKNNVNLPIHPKLSGNKKQIEHIIKSIKDFSKSA